ncbi:LAME_0E10836g1_1 [Lachancea meyersii CBS 8951]|uniref:N-acetyltransferase ECO1 n=1 Tax=Lachancea meyersii CBS 8951 TaxID=1266667 RepID=A0A1G4JL10_9SACH|nr:LAME_0E10836g1_1 [Lachancea meyersii CBS 8951]
MARLVKSKFKRDASSSKRLKQSVLTFGNRKTMRSDRCPECLMTFSPTSTKDIIAHEKYHDLHLCGRKWSSNWGEHVQEYNVPAQRVDTRPSQAPVKQQKKGSRTEGVITSSEDRIVRISKDRKNEVLATLEVLHIVNEELKAPHNENFFWSNVEDNDDAIVSRQTNRVNGTAFVYISGGRAVGVLTVEFLKTDDLRGRWMVYDTSCIVPNVTPHMKLGISRIWVCRQQRGRNIATRLLETARQHSIPGIVLAKWELAWSQPSESGAKLAKSYNSVTHERSGKLLIPCYI